MGVWLEANCGIPLWLFLFCSGQEREDSSATQVAPPVVTAAPSVVLRAELREACVSQPIPSSPPKFPLFLRVCSSPSVSWCSVGPLPRPPPSKLWRFMGPGDSRRFNVGPRLPQFPGPHPPPLWSPPWSSPPRRGVSLPWGGSTRCEGG